jgi:hypothetical protein
VFDEYLANAPDPTHEGLLLYATIMALPPGDPEPDDEDYDDEDYDDYLEVSGRKYGIPTKPADFIPWLDKDREDLVALVDYVLKYLPDASWLPPVAVMIKRALEAIDEAKLLLAEPEAQS